MMFRVEWGESALEELLSIAEAASEAARVELAASVQSINQAVRTDPFAFGEGRETNERRVGFAPPLGVSLRVYLVERVVRITGVWCYGHLGA